MRSESDLKTLEGNESELYGLTCRHVLLARHCSTAIQEQASCLVITRTTNSKKPYGGVRLIESLFPININQSLALKLLCRAPSGQVTGPTLRLQELTKLRVGVGRRLRWNHISIVGLGLASEPKFQPTPDPKGLKGPLGPTKLSAPVKQPRACPMARVAQSNNTSSSHHTSDKVSGLSLGTAKTLASGLPGLPSLPGPTSLNSLVVRPGAPSSVLAPPLRLFPGVSHTSLSSTSAEAREVLPKHVGIPWTIAQPQDVPQYRAYSSTSAHHKDPSSACHVFVSATKRLSHRLFILEYALQAT